jgi:predicted glycoside hydrolase/deacetylase ChbG (UPF0249 family)
MTRRLIVNADDLGLSPGTNQGILEAHQKGILTSTTVMINMPDAEAGIRLLQREAPQMGIGLHLNVTTGKPVLPVEEVPSLVNASGEFPYNPKDPLAYLDNLNLEEVRAEILAQFERFNQIAGRKPDHLDSHHHALYHFPTGLGLLFDLSDAHHLPLRAGCVWLVDAAYDAPRYDELREMVADALNPFWPDYFDARFYDSGVTAENLRAILMNLPEGVTEMMCHPAHNDNLQQSYAAQREVELALLTDPALRPLAAEQGIELITFADMKRA